MSDGLEFPAWLTQLGAAIAPALAVLGFVVNRADRINNRIDKNNDAAMAGIELVRNEGAEALLAAIGRFDSRHEALRQENAQQLNVVLARINLMSDTMARRDDLTAGLSALGLRLDSMNGRLDKALDRDK